MKKQKVNFLVKISMFLLLIFLCNITSQAQSISIFDIDTTNFPIMKAKLRAYDDKGNLIFPNISDLKLQEDGIERKITNITCPTAPDPYSLSACIMVDTYKYIDLARSGTQELIKFMNMPKDEIGITYMDHSTLIFQDFTKSRANALIKAGQIPSAPGVDINSMFYTPVSGGIPFIKDRKNSKKILVLVSDLHCPNLNIDENKLIEDAKKYNISIYSILLGTNDYSKLFTRIAEKTNAKVFENVKDLSQITNIFKEIKNHQQYVPCELIWESNVSCSNGKTTLEINYNISSFTTIYETSKKANAKLIVNPQYISFGKRKPLGSFDTTITIFAQNTDFTISTINLKHGSSDFIVKNPTFPLFIPKNSSKEITIQFNPSDSGLIYASFEIESDKCSAYLSAYGGFPGKKSKASTLKLNHPNGGEKFVVGIDTIISWTGVSPNDTVSLEYSIDNGTLWKLISKQVTGLKYKWINIPLPSSTQCLVRIKQSGTNFDTNSVLTLTGHTIGVEGITFSPDGSKIATVSWDRTAKIWDANTGTLIRSIKGHNREVHGIAFSPDGKSIATASTDGTAKIWDANTGTLIRSISASSFLGITFSPDGKSIATASTDGTAKIWDANTGVLILTLSGHNREVHGIAFSPDGSKVATASHDVTAKIWDANTGALILTLTGHTDLVYGIAFSPDGNKVVTASDDNTAKIWNAKTGALILTLSGHTFSVNGIAFSPDGNKVATASDDNTAKIWDANTGALILTLSGHTFGVNGIAFSPDGNKVATASTDNTAKIWEVEIPPLQEDQSDSVFSIIAPDPEFKKLDIDMGKVVLGAGKDTMVTAVLCNKGPAPLHVLGVDVTRGDTSDFMVPRGAGDFYLDSGECRDFMFEFMPTKLGLRQAKITVRSTIGDFVDTINIVGEGIDPKISISNSMIDFGKVYVGEQKDTLQVVTIKNSGTGDIEITDSKYLGPNDIDFTTISGSGKFTLKTGETRKMDLRFKPSEKGRTSGRLAFEFDGPGSPAIIQLIGEGVNKGPIIQSQDKISSDLACNNEKVDTIQIENIGNQNLNILSAKFKGTNPSDFELATPFSPFFIAPNNTYNFVVKFKPSSSGDKVADLEILSNSVEEDTINVQVRANYFKSDYSVEYQTLDLGTVCLNKTIDTTLKIFNKGDYKNNFKLNFSSNLEKQISNIDILPNSDFSNKIQFISKNEGLINERITIKDTICGIEKIVNIIGEVQSNEISVANADIVGRVGTIASTDLILENKKSHKITITDTSAIAPFYYENLTLPITLDSAEKKTIKVNYQVKDKTKYSISASFISGDCNDSSKALITNKSVNSSAKLQINTVSAYPGDTINIPIILKDVEDLESSNSKNLTVDLTFNATLLEPIGNTPIGSLSNDKKLRTITLQFSKNVIQDSILGTLKFKVGLGNDSTTSLELSNQSSDSNDVNLSVASGEFHLLGICRAAGPRLINPNGEVKLSLIRPNPVGDNGELDIETIENGQTELYIVNLKGEKVSTLYQGELAAGKQTLIISTKYLSNGTYFVILQTPTVTQKVKMEVVK